MLRGGRSLQVRGAGVAPDFVDPERPLLEGDAVNGSDNVLSVEDLKVHFPLERSLSQILRRKPAAAVRAVNGVSLQIPRNEVLGLVGETGCGKSTLVKTIMGINRPTAGRILFEGHDVGAFDRRQRNAYYSKVQMIWQDPYSCLNPTMKIRDIISTPARNFHGLTRSEAYARVREIADIVGLTENELGRYPHEFSGGGRQRIVIARALISRPTFLIADEPTSSLDVSIQAQILNLLISLTRQFSLTMLLISHDLAIINFAADRVAVMYFGKIVEEMPKKHIFSKSYHWYTAKLVDAVPRGKRRIAATTSEDKGNILNHNGCIYYHQCVNSQDKCLNNEPPLVQKEEGHYVACHFPRNTDQGSSAVA
jgi:oligopeptide/dipeptide ABC transporter ATP-binding protein